MSIIQQHATEAAAAAASGAKAMTYTGAGTAVYFGLTNGQWSVVGVIGGLILGALGLIVNAGITFYFKRQHLKLAARRVLPAEDI
jgi:hypothetical protein